MKNESKNSIFFKTKNRDAQESNRKIIVFDMDGTLYQLDGEKNGYTGSSLEQKVLQNTKKYIQTLCACDAREAEIVLEQGLQDPIGLSAYLSDRYGVTRQQYFNAVWDIDPKNTVQNFDIPVQTINALSKTEKKLVLLTSAPKIWQSRVTDFLGITDAFESIYTAENFQTKQDIFEMLSKRYMPKNILSIGDQEETDITPAEKLGWNTMYITSPSELERIAV